MKELGEVLNDEGRSYHIALARILCCESLEDAKAIAHAAVRAFRAGPPQSWGPFRALDRLPVPIIVPEPGPYFEKNARSNCDTIIDVLVMRVEGQR